VTKRASIKGKGLGIFDISEPGKESPAISPDIIKGAKQESREASQSEKDSSKETFYIPREISQELDTVWMELRRTTKRVSKSGMVALAVESMLRRHKINPQASELADWVTSILAQKRKS